MYTSKIVLAACVSGWISYSDYCYQYVSTLASWNEARRTCQFLAPDDKQGDLASVSDRFNNLFLSKLTTKYVWIGGYQNEEDQWNWSDGRRWLFSSWGTHQPSDGKGIQNHLVFNYQSSPGSWSDGNMNAERGFICQYRDPGKQQNYYITIFQLVTAK